MVLSVAEQATRDPHSGPAAASDGTELVALVLLAFFKRRGWF